MLAKQQRLTAEAFDQYFKCGKRYHSPNLQLIHTSGTDFHGAVVVGKKVFKTAVKRNRLRRQLYDVLYRLVRHQSHAGVFILIVKPGAKQVAAKALQQETLSLLGRVV